MDCKSNFEFVFVKFQDFLNDDIICQLNYDFHSLLCEHVNLSFGKLVWFLKNC